MAYDFRSTLAVAGLFYLAIFLVLVIANWKIWSKAGYHGAWSLLLLVPFVNLVAFLYFAFAEWPVTRRVRALEGGLRI